MAPDDGKDPVTETGSFTWAKRCPKKPRPRGAYSPTSRFTPPRCRGTRASLTTKPFLAPPGRAATGTPVFNTRSGRDARYGSPGGRSIAFFENAEDCDERKDSGFRGTIAAYERFVGIRARNSRKDGLWRMVRLYSHSRSDGRGVTSETARAKGGSDAECGDRGIPGGHLQAVAPR
jgi:hypothetical protein